MSDTSYREYVLDQAVRAGKFSAARSAHYREMYDRDPQGTERLIASLAPGLPPSAETAARAEESRPYPPGLFPELTRPRRGRGGLARAPQAESSAVLGGTALAPAPVETLPPALPAAAAVATPEQVAQWSAALFPEIRERLGAPSRRITWAND